jgi:RNA polymerase sigma factor (sigma-70 family)
MTKVIVPPLAAKILTPSLLASHWLNQRLVADTTAIMQTLAVVNRLQPPAIGVPTGFLHPVLQALRTMQRDRQRVLRIAFRPGSFYGDVLVVLDAECTDDVRYQALRRLASKHLTLRYVYQASPGLQRRWSIVRPHFEAYCQERGLSYTQGWEQLTVPIVCDLVLSLPGDITFGELRWYLARGIRREIERELLGRTVDQHDPVDRLVVTEDVPDELADVRLEVWLVLQRLDPLDRELLIDVFVHGLSYRELAEQYGTSERTIRRRTANILRWLRYE